MFEIALTNSFKSDLNYYKDNEKVKSRLREIYGFFLQYKRLPAIYKDHALKGEFTGYRECHVSPDLLLIYKVNEQKKVITLAHLGSHSDLF